MKKQSLYIVVSVCVLTILMNIIDIFIDPEYFIRSFIKVILFFLVPVIYFISNRKEVLELKKLFVPRRVDFAHSLLLGVVCYLLILLFYFLLEKYFDFSNITKNLTSDIGVTADNFVYVSLYISLFNSFLEEFFFRGFAFITLRKHTSGKFAYIFSSFLFAFYHIGMTLGWVHIFVFLLGFVGLIIGGFMFNYLNDKTNNIYPSWFVHMFINFGINTIGFILFGII